MATTKVQSELIVDDVALAGNPTTTTQSAGNNTTRIATTAFVSTAINNLINSAPGTLDTLDEIAAAINDDANFNTTVTNAIATKLNLSGGTLTGGLTGTTASFSGIAKAANFEFSGTGGKIHFGGSGDTGDYVQIQDVASTSDVFAVVQDSGVKFGVDGVTGSGRFPIANSNLGVGDDPFVSTNYSTINVRGTTGGQILMGRNSGVNDWDFFVYTTDGTTRLGTGSGDALALHTDSSGSNNERLLIDSSGRIYIGKSASNIGVSGIELNPGGYLQVTESSSPSLYLSRITSDGNIIDFFKDSTQIGQIGTYGGAFYLGGGTGSNAGGLMFNGTSIEPTTGSTGRVDGTVSIGSSTYGLNSVVLSHLGLGKTAATTSVGHTASDVEGIFWHSNKSDYYIARTAGAWSGPNYSQLKLDWDTGIIIDGGTAYGKSGVEILGPIASSNGGMVLQTQEAYNNSAVSTSGTGVTIISTTITVLANSRLAVWFNSGQILSAGNLSNPNFEIKVDNASISDQNSNHYWYDTSKGTSGRVFMQGQAISGALSAGTRTITVIGNVYNGSATFNYQSQGAHIIVQEISKDL